MSKEQVTAAWVVVGVSCVLAIILFTNLFGATKTFNVGTGMIDAYISSDLADSAMAGGVSTTLRMGEDINKLFFGDYSIDDTLTAVGSLTVDSAYFIYRVGGSTYATADTSYLYLSGITDDRDWVETQVTHNSYKTGSAWSTAGGDLTGTISDSAIFFSTWADNTIDTLIIRRTGTAKGAQWLDSVKVSTGNFGFRMANLKKAGATYRYILLYSTENTTAANRPTIVIFYTVESAAGQVIMIGN
jgi:hypothetical protein